ncbi:MAG: hypothetical protein KAI43_07630 [Candidatus Aureabacteria bacterium]|nr:hypothetical protein [Candidatus Auribacterota bacterium]
MLENNGSGLSIAYFISPHGFGHAARACAVISALLENEPSITFEIFTTVPAWFFKDSFVASFNYHKIKTDIGLVQDSPVKEDLNKTIEALENYIPFKQSVIDELTKKVIKAKCKLIICDIAPLGIEVSKKSGIRSLLIENFMWDWIYEGYSKYDKRIISYAEYYSNIFKKADHHIQTEPVCLFTEADIVTNPVCRNPLKNKKDIRNRLKIPDEKKMILISMGGVREQYDFLEKLKKYTDMCFVIPGGSESFKIEDNLVLIPFHSDFYHPSLVASSDGVIGKAGYSTLSEAYWAGVPFMYITRKKFCESEVLDKYIQKNMHGISMTEEEYQKGEWVSKIQKLVELPTIKRKGTNGAYQIAEFITNLLQKNK